MNEISFSKIKWYFIAGILFLLIGPYLFTRSWGFISFNDHTGVIGDTIGGITSPIASIIGSLLVFFALKSQIEANKLIFEQFEYQKKEELFRKLSSYISEQIKLIREDIQDVVVTPVTTKTVKGEVVKESREYRGPEGISKILETISNIDHQTLEEEIIDSTPSLFQIKLILERFDYLLDESENENLKKEDAIYLKNLISYTYEYKIRVVLKIHEESRMSKVEPCEDCGMKHNGIPEIIYEFYDRINKKILPTTSTIDQI